MDDGSAPLKEKADLIKLYVFRTDSMSRSQLNVVFTAMAPVHSNISGSPFQEWNELKWLWDIFLSLFLNTGTYFSHPPQYH